MLSADAATGRRPPARHAADGRAHVPQRPVVLCRRSGAVVLWLCGCLCLVGVCGRAASESNRPPPFSSGGSPGALMSEYRADCAPLSSAHGQRLHAQGLPDCWGRQCAAVALHDLPRAVLREMEVAGGSGDHAPEHVAGIGTDVDERRGSGGISQAFHCVVEAGDTVRGPCACRVPTFALQKAMDEERPASARGTVGKDGTPERLPGKGAHGLVMTGDSTMRMLAHAALQVLGDPLSSPMQGRPLSADAKKAAMESIAALQSDLDTLSWTRAMEIFTKKELRRWPHNARGVYDRTGFPDYIMSDVSPKNVCPERSKCERAGLVVVNFGLHFLHLPPARNEPKAAMFAYYKQFVAGFLLAVLQASEKCSCPMFVTWRTNNVICDRTNEQRHNAYTSSHNKIEALRKRLGVRPRRMPSLKEQREQQAHGTYEPPDQLTEKQAALLKSLSRSRDKTAADQAAHALAPTFSSVTPSGSVLGTLDGFGSELARNRSVVASDLVHAYLLEGSPNTSFVQVMSKLGYDIGPHPMPVNMSHITSIADATPHGPKHVRIKQTFDNFRLLGRTWTTARHNMNKHHAAFRLLPPYDAFPISAKFCEHTPNDARHYAGEELVEIRVLYAALLFLDKAVEEHRHMVTA